MKFDIFLSICQTPVDGRMPDERGMFRNFFEQVALADELGFGTAWVAETHLSCQVQKRNPDAVIPQFEGEIGLNTDILQLAHLIFERTRRINVGSAIRNILCNGGPLAHAEAVRTFLTLHGLRQNEERLLELGFAAGRFPFSNIPYGIRPRTRTEEAGWPVVKTRLFQTAVEIFLRGLRGDVFSAGDLEPRYLYPSDFRSPADWERVRATYADETGAKKEVARIPVPSFWSFDQVGVIPFEAPMKLLRLTIGTHDGDTQELANTFLPCGVFNLSITPAKEIEATHRRMQAAYHPAGGKWRRRLMPRTVLVFINGDKRLTAAQQSAQARAAAIKANQIYWRAMEKTLDPAKVEQAVDNALVGNPEEVAHQIRSRFHADDRLMLWFDFNNHDSESVMASMRLFMQKVAPAVT